MPAWAQEVFGPVAPVIRFSTAEEAAAIAAQTEYGLSLGILTRDVMRGLDLARRSRPASCTSTSRPSTTRPTCPSAASSTQAPAPASAAPPTWTPSPRPAGSPSAATSRPTRSDRRPPFVAHAPRNAAASGAGSGDAAAGVARDRDLRARARLACSAPSARGPPARAAERPSFNHHRAERTPPALAAASAPPCESEEPVRCVIVGGQLPPAGRGRPAQHPFRERLVGRQAPTVPGGERGAPGRVKQNEQASRTDDPGGARAGLLLRLAGG